MDIETTAPALVAEEPTLAVEAPEAGSTDTPEDAEYSAAFARATKDGVDEDLAEPDAPEAKEEEAEAIVADVVVDAPPSDLPGGIKAAWATIPEDARKAIADTHREMGRKLADQGRLVSGLNPIREVLTRAAQEIPNLANMRPEQVAGEIFELAKISRQFSENPLQTMVGLAKKHGIEGAMLQALSGQAVTQDSSHTAALQAELKTLRQQVSNMANPEYLRNQVSQITNETRVFDDVTKFSSTAEHWKEVEDYLPQYIPLVQAELGDGASPSDVLAAAYELAVQRRLPGAKAKSADSFADVPMIDPKKTEAAIKARSVNVKGGISGQARTMTEDESLSAAYRRAQSR